jgi:tetratricopeptide (TPR) repeat protein
MPDVETSKEDRHRFTSLPLVQREVALVLVLCFISVGLFAATKSIADWSRRSSARDAAWWYDQGQALLGANKTDQGIAALRRAVVGDRQNVPYALALARALTAGNHDEEAKQLLLRLRDLEPDDAEINYRLARLAVKAGNTAEAVRYFNHAMYGLTPTDPRYDRRRLREELASFLLDQGDKEEAENELNALARELPDEPAGHIELARLFERAGDPRQAVTQYQLAATFDPKNVDALVGAGEAAFGLHEFTSAEHYLAQAGELGALPASAAADLQTARVVLAADPLAAGIGMTERVNRLTAGLARVAKRLDDCTAAAAGGGAASAAADPLRAELQTFRRQPRESLRDTDVLARGVELAARASAAAGQRCGGPDPADQAWILIGQVHGGPR